MEYSFRWGEEFETGLPAIDEQHHHLIDLINQFGGMVMESHVNESHVVMLFAELTEYTHYHFTDEEALMEKQGLHPKYIASHKAIHRKFIDQLEQLKQHSKLDAPEEWERLLEFLYAWLVYHILGHDKDIARQVRLIESGMAPLQAMNEGTDDTHMIQIEPLMRALHNMVDLLTERNTQLDDLNRSLEEKVQARTLELEEANRKLEAISLTDVLTGLPNRRHALQHLNGLWQDAKQTGEPLSCLMIDADYFKDVNDTYGHEAGDQVLVLLSRTLQENIRSDDFLARLGGDEFLIICPETALDGALELAAFLLEKVKQIDLDFSGKGSWRSSISIGAAENSAEVLDTIALLARADTCLYEAKDAGRGCARS